MHLLAAWFVIFSDDRGFLKEGVNLMALMLYPVSLILATKSCFQNVTLHTDLGKQTYTDFSLWIIPS